MSTEPDVVFKLQQLLPEGLPCTETRPETELAVTSLPAPRMSTDPLMVDASIRAPGFVMFMEPEAACTRISPLTLVALMLPDALFARKSSARFSTVIEPLAEETCTDRSILLTAID